MKKIIFCLMLGLFLFSFVTAQITFNKYYKIDLNYNEENFKLLNLNIEFSDTLIENYFGFYLAEIIDYNHETLNLTFFDVPNEIFYDEVDEEGIIFNGGLLELDEVNFSIYVPYYENANEIIIYNANLTEKLKIDVSMYSKISKEELEQLKEAKKPEELIKEKLEEREAKTLTEKLVKFWWVLVIILLILVIILIRGFKKRN